ncbi:MAG: hypothetical protein JOZ27_00565 [Caulobacteraceae bacterium]|nr:hypothetical protein [Caulobacteraceae bacterium]
MDKSIFGLTAALGALAALPAAANPSDASQPALPRAQSWSELLDPIPNAVEKLQLVNAEDAAQPRLIEAQYVAPVVAHHHHHHSQTVYVQRHHHHHYVRVRRYRHVRRVVVVRHHHHHHHNNY